MSMRFKRQLPAFYQMGVFLIGVCMTNHALADEISRDDSPPPNSSPPALPGKPEETSPPLQEPWHWVPSTTIANPASTEEPRYHSNAQRIAGGVLIGLGAASLIGFGVVAGLAEYNNRHYNAEGGGLLFVFVGLPLLVGGIACEGIGIPLYLNGSKPPEGGDARVKLPPPMTLSVGVSPRSAALKLTF